MAEILGEGRILVDSVYVPEERRGLYSNENEALRFCKGRIINDEDPYEKVAHEVK